MTRAARREPLADRHRHLPTVHEFPPADWSSTASTRDKQVAVLIGRVDRRGRTQWTLPKGHIEVGERAEQTAYARSPKRPESAATSSPRWAASSTGSAPKTTWCTRRCTIICCGSSTVSRAPSDHEVGEVAWVPLDELRITACARRRASAGGSGRAPHREIAHPRSRCAAAAAAELTAAAAPNTLDSPSSPPRRPDPSLRERSEARYWQADLTGHGMRLARFHRSGTARGRRTGGIAGRA